MNHSWPTGANPWRELETRTLYHDRWLGLESRRVVRPDGAEEDYAIVHMRKRGVGVLPIDADGCVTLVGQWRLPLERYSWEMPAGGCEDNEATLDAAKRELREETGLTANRWIKALDLDLSTSLTDERAVTFIAIELDAGEAKPEAREVITGRAAHFLEVLARISSGEVREAATVATLLCAHQMAVSGALPNALARAMLNRPSAK